MPTPSILCVIHVLLYRSFHSQTITFSSGNCDLLRRHHFRHCKLVLDPRGEMAPQGTGVTSIGYGRSASDDKTALGRARIAETR
jgi:hypothetical protein